MIIAQEVKKLRDLTGASMIQCKKALEESSGNLENAQKMLRKKGLKTASKKTGRSASEGYLGSYIHSNGKVGVLIEINCETDFVARSGEFREFAHDLAMHIAAFSPLYVRDKEIDPKTIKNKKEELAEEIKKENKPSRVAEKIVEGKMKKYLNEICLLNQPFVKDPDKTVEELLTEKIVKFGENINIKKFVRFEI